jgi:hypothetical protein
MVVSATMYLRLNYKVIKELGLRVKVCYKQGKGDNSLETGALKWIQEKK